MKGAVSKMPACLDTEQAHRSHSSGFVVPLIGSLELKLYRACARCDDPGAHWLLIQWLRKDPWQSSRKCRLELLLQMDAQALWMFRYVL